MDGRLQRHAHILHSVLLWALVLGALGLIVFGSWMLAHKVTAETAQVSIGKATFSTKLARTEKELERGLGGVQELQPKEGMLFVFNSSQEWTIWMKGMRIPIDIVWLDENKKVVHIERNVQPDAYPYIVYAPPEPAKYVLELKAGSAQRYDITNGSTALFVLPPKKGAS